jgi:dinuclear metal center YbgI/SA1388 family protein
MNRKKRTPAPKPPASLTLGGLEALLDEIAPADLADEWDNVGLLLGDAAQPVRRILVALEADGAVLDEARRLDAETLVLHHPLPFRPLKKIVASNPAGRLLLRAARAGISIIAAHTNLDRSPWGTNRALADHVGLSDAEILEPAPRNDSCKFVVYVPHGHETAIIEAIGRAGAGIIGNYSHCTFRSPGTGTYIPLSGANPFAGKIGQLEQAEEFRLECIVARDRLQRLVAEVRAVHPYEEVAFDVLPLLDGQSRWGLGLIGPLEKPTTLRGLAGRLKRQLGLSGLQIVGNPERHVTRVAIASGSGKSLVERLDPRAVDALITGELDHHAAADAREKGLAVLCLGHHESEAVVVPYLVRWLQAQAPITNAGIEVIESRASVPPFLIV